MKLPTITPSVPVDVDDMLATLADVRRSFHKSGGERELGAIDAALQLVRRMSDQAAAVLICWDDVLTGRPVGDGGAR
jgi:hypothetical protein